MANFDDIHSLDPDPSHDVIVPPQTTSNEKKSPKGGTKSAKKLMFIIGAIVIVAITAGVALYILTGRVDKEDVELVFSGTENVKSGEEATFQIGYANNHGRITWKDTKLKLVPPQGFEFISADLTPTDQENLVWDLGEVSPETEQIIEVKAKFYGDANSTLKLEGVLEFTPDAFGSQMTEIATFEPGIVPPNVSIDLDSPTTVNAGSEVTYELEVTNNEKTNYNNASVKFVLPQGFTMTRSEPSLAEGKETWDYEKIEPGKKEYVTVYGRLDGVTDEKKNVLAQLSVNYKDVSYVQLETSAVTVISAPTISIKQTVSTQVVEAGEVLRFLLKIKNVGSSALTNLTLVNTLDSKVIDPLSVSIDRNGVLRGSEIVWDNTVLEPLRFLEPNEEFEIGFSLGTYKNITPTAKEFSIISKPKITTGTQEVGGDPIMVKVKTKLEITDSASPFDESGNPVGSGPTKPQVGQTTTYRVKWNIVNRYNNISKTKLVCNIPLGTTYTKKFQVTEGTTFVYDEVLKNVVWEIGDMNPKNETETKSQVSGYFDVSITPAAPNLGKEMFLTQNCTLTARDTFVDQDISIPIEDLLSESIE